VWACDSPCRCVKLLWYGPCRLRRVEEGKGQTDALPRSDSGEVGGPLSRSEFSSISSRMPFARGPRSSHPDCSLATTCKRACRSLAAVCPRSSVLDLVAGSHKARVATRRHPCVRRTLRAAFHTLERWASKRPQFRQLVGAAFFSRKRHDAAVRVSRWEGPNGRPGLVPLLPWRGTRRGSCVAQRRQERARELPPALTARARREPISHGDSRSPLPPGTFRCGLESGRSRRWGSRRQRYCLRPVSARDWRTRAAAGATAELRG